MNPGGLLTQGVLSRGGLSFPAGQSSIFFSTYAWVRSRSESAKVIALLGLLTVG